MKYYRTNTENKISHKDHYCALFDIVGEGSTKIVYVNLLDSTIQIDGSLYCKNKSLAQTVYEFAWFNGGFRRMSEDLVKFLLVVGYMTADSTDYLAKVAEEVEEWNKSFGSILRARMTKSGNVKLAI